jgi:hypothetical protein
MAQENKLLARNNKTGLRLFSKCQLRFPCVAGGGSSGGPGTTQKVRLGRSHFGHLPSPQLGILPTPARQWSGA